MIVFLSRCAAELHEPDSEKSDFSSLMSVLITVSSLVLTQNLSEENKILTFFCYP